ncbi:hypothetical protein L3X37_02865 [Sabulilitoribacter arenilitoris]|uniref:Uncharacterized protein n=1 Tax=Wocania arenilitoris TaxID=2044858 RepID=A0AAE3JKP6_9FLAO|nr:hypothetical protein [Wocania arenilitoris]MCF7567307.1 hypothetical protein [Wocania arenilitoris]
MNLLQPKENKTPLNDCLKTKIYHLVKGLDRFNQSENQKNLELCQVGKFLCTYFPDFKISESREQPDFIITNGSIKIGLEHQSIFVDKILERTGFFKNIALLAERELEKEVDMPNFLVNCYIRKGILFSNKDKNHILKIFIDVIREFVINDIVIKNNLFDDLIKMPHSQKSINANFGAYMVPTLNEEKLLKAIDKKEKKVKKVKKYISNTNCKQWLLLLIGGVGEHSFYVKNDLKLSFETAFEKVFLLEDFDNHLYELK